MDNNNQRMKRRHSGHSNHSGNGGQHRRPQQGRHGGGNFQNNRPRKNYAALREKYMNMARDAMGMGDRVLAEYYLQHADHYFRMQAEFLEERNQRNQIRASEGQPPEPVEESAEDEGSVEEEMNIPNNSNVLPAFLTQQLPQAQPASSDASENPATNRSWEEE